MAAFGVGAPIAVALANGLDKARVGPAGMTLTKAEATVKRFYREADHVRLQPENDEMEPILSREVRVLGRVVGLMRSM